MLVRIFSGSAWAAATLLGDFEFEQVPAIGQKLALNDGAQWIGGQVRDVVHRIVDPAEAADVALLLGGHATAPLASEPLPLALLDGLAPRQAAAAVPGTARPSPVGRLSREQRRLLERFPARWTHLAARKMR